MDPWLQKNCSLTLKVEVLLRLLVGVELVEVVEEEGMLVEVLVVVIVGRSR